MFSNRLKIDDTDIWDEFGIYIQDGGLDGLIQLPSMKSIYEQEWAEYDGIECDLTDPKLDSKEFDIKLAIDDRDGNRNAPALFNDFERKYLDGNYHIWYFVEIGKKYKLRYVSESSVKFLKVNTRNSVNTEITHYDGMLFTIKMSDDFPQYLYTPIDETRTITRPSITEAGWKRFEKLDDVSKFDNLYLFRYGAILLDDSMIEFFKSAEMKTALILNIDEMDGRLMTSQFGKHKGRQAKINLLMSAPTIKELIDDYYALLYQMSRAGSHRLVLKRGTQVEQANVYYKTSAVSKFFYVNKLWLQFSITFQIID